MSRSPQDGTSFHDARERLRSAQKTNFGAPAYSRWVNRRAGSILAAAAFRLGLTPNQVTGISVLLSYLGIAVVLLVPPAQAVGALVVVLLLTGYAFDSADGQLARLRGGGSPAGEWLDHVADMGKMTLLHGAVAISWVRFGTGGAPVPWPLLTVPILFTAVSTVSFFAWLLVDLLRRATGMRVPETAAQDEHAPWLRSVLRLPSDYGLLACLFALFGTMWFAWAYSLLFLANLVILLAALPVWFRQADQLRR